MHLFAFEHRARHAAALFSLVALAAWLVHFFGRTGFMPLDQSIVFDGAWRLLSGQVPYRDFSTPNGVPAMAMQALFFLAGGVSWASYLLHAQVVNALFAIAVYGFVFAMSGRILLAFGYGALAALFFYPPFGVPYMDQHAFFFGFLAVAAFHGGILSSRFRIVAWTLIPPLMALAFLSKQTGSVFLGLLLGVAILAALVARPRDYRTAAGALVISGMATLLALLLLARWLGISWEGFREAFFDLPSAVGRERFAGRGLPSELQLVWRAILITLPLWLALPRALTTGGEDSFGRRMLAFTGVGLALVTYLFVRLTLNQAENGLAYVVPAVAIGHVLLARGGGLGRGMSLFMAVFLALLLQMGLVQVNGSRVVGDFRPGEVAQAVDGDSVAPALAALKFVIPARTPGERSPEAYRDLVAFLSGTRDNFLLIGDSAILYGLTGHPSAFPALWIHEGLTFPRDGAPARAAFDERLSGSMRKYRIRYVVVDGTRTMMGSTVGDFAPLRSCLQGVAPVRTMGRFSVFELPAGCPADTP